MQALRLVFQQEGYGGVHRGVMDGVIVVEHQRQLAPGLVQVIDQAGEHHLGRNRLRSIDHLRRIGAGAPIGLQHRGGQIGEEEAGLVVGAVQRQPGRGQSAASEGGHGERGLAKPGWRSDHRQRAAQPIQHPPHQPRPVDDLRAGARYAQFGTDERFGFLHGGAGLGSIRLIISARARWRNSKKCAAENRQACHGSYEERIAKARSRKEIS